MGPPGGPARRTFLSLDVPNFRRFFLGQLISQTGSWMNRVTQVLLVLHLTDSGVAVGALAVAQLGPLLLLGPWAGLVADRSDKRRLLMLEQTVAMAVSLALALVAFMDEPPVAGVFLLAVLGGVVTAIDHPARRAIVAELVPPDHIQNAVSLNSAVVTSAKVLGPALAGLVIESVGYGWAFLADGLSYVAVLVSLRLIDGTTMYTPPRSERGRGQIREGMRYVWATPELRVVLGVSAVVSAFALNLTTSIPLLVTMSLDGDSSDFTLLFSVISVGSVLGALLAARRSRAGSIELLAAAGVLGAVSMGFATVPSIEVALPAAVLVGVSSVTFMSLSTTLVQQRTDPTMRGRVLALHAMALFGAAPIGGPVLGGMADAWGARSAVAFGGVTALAAAAWGGLAARRHREDAPPGADGFPASVHCKQSADTILYTRTLGEGADDRCSREGSARQG